MGRYVVRRLLLFVPTVLGALALLHYLTTLAIQFTGDPARAIFGDRSPTEAEMAAVQKVFGTDNPCYRSKGSFCWGPFVDRLHNMFLRGDFGVDSRERPVLTLIGEAAPTTARLALIAVSVDIIIGVAVGVVAGLRRGSFRDHLVRASTILIIAVPVFVLAYYVQVGLGVGVGGWLTRTDADPMLRAIFSVSYTDDYPVASLLIPGIMLGVTALATTARLTRTTLMENLRADSVRTARAKGLTPARVVGVHTLRNSLIPVVTHFGLALGALMGGAVVTEGIFNIHGVGLLIIKSLRTGESSITVVVVTILVLVYLVVNLAIDLLYAVLDPRIRYE